MNKPQGILLVLSGPSGAGKGTICGRLLEKRDHMAYSVSCTTREPRKGEVDGKNYFFKTREEFEEMIKNGGLLEHASVYGNYYGTPRQYVLDKLNEGLDVVLEIDPQGALQVKKSYLTGCLFSSSRHPLMNSVSAFINAGLMRLMSSSADSAQRHRN